MRKFVQLVAIVLLHGIVADRMSGKCHDLTRDMLVHYSFSQVLLNYRDAMERAVLLDFDDLMSKAVSLLKVPSVQRSLGIQYLHILTDECQVRELCAYNWMDTSPLVSFVFGFHSGSSGSIQGLQSDRF